ncbi:MAG: hypothetical protein ACU85E_06635 [Gammaproteobacteria bacterium]
MKLIRIAIIWSFFSFALYFSPNSLAREWYFQPNVSIQSFYDTNIRLLSDQNKARTNADAFGFISYANANFGVRSDDYDIGINATGVIKRYISELDLDNDNVYVTAKSVFNVTERSVFGLNGRYANETTLGNVIDTLNSAQQNTQRTTLFINPEWTYALSELSSVRVDYKHFDVSYDDTTSQIDSQRFFNNTTDSSSIELLHQWNASMKSHAVFEALIFDVPDRNQTTNNYNFNVGIDYSFSETWTGSFGGGFHVTDTETNTGAFTSNDESVGPLFLFKTKKIFETSMMEAGYYRQTASRGRGGFSLVDVSYFGYTQKLSDQFQVGVRGTYNDVRGLISTNTNDLTFYTAGASASWLISPQMDLTGSYQYRFRESQETSANNADSNAFFLTFNYKWDAFSTRKF